MSKKADLKPENLRKDALRRRIYWSMRIAPREAIGTMFLGLLSIFLLIALLRSQADVRDLLEVIAFGPEQLDEPEEIQQPARRSKRGCGCC